VNDIVVANSSLTCCAIFMTKTASLHRGKCNSSMRSMVSLSNVKRTLLVLRRYQNLFSILLLVLSQYKPSSL